jgi:hypothetical protein
MSRHQTIGQFQPWDGRRRDARLLAHLRSPRDLLAEDGLQELMIPAGSCRQQKKYLWQMLEAKQARTILTFIVN